MKIKKQININRFLPGVQKNILLKNYTTFKIGGKAKYFFVAKTKKDLILAITVAKKLKIPFFILGGGSNLLASDQGYKGLIIKFQIPNSKFQNPKIYVEAGAMLRELVNATAKAGLSSLEWAAGIPGTVGGAIYGNAGAFQKSMKDIIEKVEVFDTEELRIKNYELSDCQFDYRNSIFKRNKNLIILSAKIKLKKGKKKEIQKKIKEYLNYKKEKQPLNYPSAGSVFKNFTQYRNKISGAGPKELKRFKKMGAIPAAWLIDKCGLKGKKIGEAQISKIHANFIVNRNRAKAKDVKKLINLMKKKVKQKFGLVLKEEIEYL